MIQHLENILYFGDYEDLISKVPHLANSYQNGTSFGLLVAALAMRSRLAEAEAYFRKHIESFDSETLFLCRFHLGICCTRQSEYAKARFYFGQNLIDRKTTPSTRQLFYAEQGMAFFRFFCGRYSNALAHAERALTLAIESHFPYGHCLALDVLGHVQVHLGSVSEGLVYLENALALAKTMQSVRLREAIEVSLACYKAEHCFDNSNFENLLSLNERISDLDTYSRTKLLLSLAKRQILRGESTNARATLVKVSPLIYGFKNKRYQIELNLCHAKIYDMKGDHSSAFNLVQNTKILIHPEVDLALERPTLALELALIKKLGFKLEDCRIFDRIKYLDRRMNGYRLPTEESLKHLAARIEAKKMCEHTKSEPLIDTVVETGFYGLLYDLLSMQRTKTVIYFDLVPRGITIFSNGDVVFSRSKTTQTEKALFFALMNGPLTKQEIIEKVWHYRYNPLIHDHLIHTTVSRIRSKLGKWPDLLETTEHGYQLAKNVQICCVFKTQEEVVSDAQPAIEIRQDLNHRQNTFLNRFDFRSPINTRTYRDLFGVSEITALRDLASLAEKGYLKRVGGGRSTEYTRSTPN
ncbi:MAG: winged helix-turn-helix domain-containing protein [Oligoflexales bacterium]